MGSTTIDTALPGFRVQNDMDFGTRNPLASIWIGNRTRIAAHHDLPDNLACVVAGHRRFTLFPPEQLANLYVGPLDFTPAGQAISLVDFAKPDYTRFPRFAQALQAARVAELGPGDALFIPSMWWHHIESLDAFNVLVNYWWRQSPAYMDSPMSALMLAHHDGARSAAGTARRLAEPVSPLRLRSRRGHRGAHSRAQPPLAGAARRATVRDMRARLLARLNR